MSTNPFKKAIESRKESEPIPPESITPVQPLPSPEPKKRGRPATGKRSDDAWIGRTYYVRRETDLDIEDELLKFKRSGIDIDKSELVDQLLSAWVKWQKGENIEIQLFSVSPIQKGENMKS